MAHRVHIADYRSAAMAVAAVRAPSAELALNTLILSVILVLLPGAAWMLAT